MRLPTADDLRSDTVKTGALATLFGAIGALAQGLGAGGLIPQSTVNTILAVSPYALIVVGYLSSYFRINQKTILK
jgi:hypothetical protein